jgi:hypothetical protein
MQPAYLKGAAFGFVAASIWASWSVVTRLAITTGLDASDIVALRFAVAGVLLSPLVIRRGLARESASSSSRLASTLPAAGLCRVGSGANRSPPRRNFQGMRRIDPECQQHADEQQQHRRAERHLPASGPIDEEPEH